MNYKLWFRVGFLCFLARGQGHAEQSKRDGKEDYLLVATDRTSTLKKELSEVVGSGHRVVAVWSGDDGELLMILDRPEPATPREVELLATLKLETMEKELTVAAADGFRIIPNGILLNKSQETKEGAELVLVLERTAGSDQRHEYRFVHAYNDYEYVPNSVAPEGAIDIKPLQEQLNELAEEGYDVVGLVSRSADGLVIRKVVGPLGVEVRVRRVYYLLIGEKEVGAPSPGPDTVLELSERYRLIAGKGGALQNKLNDAAAAGYRLRFTTFPPPPITRKKMEEDMPKAFGAGFPEVVLLMEKTAEPTEDFQFGYLVESSAGPITLKYQMTAAGKRGYRLHPASIFSRPLSVIMERAPGEQMQHAYQALETSRTKTLKKEVDQTSANGYAVVAGGLSQQGQHMVLLEKSLGTPAEAVAPPTPGLTPSATGGGKAMTLATRKSDTMQEELDQAAAEGYRVMAVSAPPDNPYSGGELVLTLEKSPTRGDPFEYAVVGANRIKTMAKDLNEAAADGFRMMPGTVLLKHGMFNVWEIFTLMEKMPGGDARYEYVMLGANRESTLEKEIEEAMAQGYEIVGSANRVGEHLAFLERRAPK